MSNVATAPHELEGNLNFFEYGLGPYWITSKLLFDGFDGYGEIETEIAGEEWTINLKYQKSGIAPRPEDDLNVDRLYEFRIGMYGRGERKANFHIRPRFAKMEHFESGDQITSPCDSENYPAEATNVHISGSNLEPDAYPVLLRKGLQALATDTETRVNSNYFTQIHSTSNITTYERYVRVRRTMGEKFVRSTGAMRRILELLAQKEGASTVYKPNNAGPNEDIVGYNHRLVLPKADARELIPMHSRGKQIKHYHPQYVHGDEENPLHHPKIGVLLKKSLNKSRAFSWSERGGLRREIDETLINTLRWSGIPIGASGTTFIADDHFDAAPAEKDVEFFADPTPDIEASQEALLITTLRDMTDADVDVLETLVTDGGSQHPSEIASEAERGISTIYRALERLDGLVRNENACVEFVSRKIEQEIAAIIENTEHRIKSAADRTAKLLNVDAKQAESSSFQKWMQQYAASFDVNEERGERTVRIDTLLSKYKATSEPHAQEVLDDARTAWVRDGRDVLDLLEAYVEVTIDGEKVRSPMRKLVR